MTHKLKKLPSTGFLRLPQVLELIPVSKSTWWAGINSGKYPKQIHISERLVAWKIEDILALIETMSAPGIDK